MRVRGYLPAAGGAPCGVRYRDERVLVCVAADARSSEAVLFVELLALLTRRGLVAVVDFDGGCEGNGDGDGARSAASGGGGGGESAPRTSSSALLSPASDRAGGCVGVVRELALFATAVCDAFAARRGCGAECAVTGAATGATAGAAWTLELADYAKLAALAPASREDGVATPGTGLHDVASLFDEWRRDAAAYTSRGGVSSSSSSGGSGGKRARKSESTAAARSGRDACDAARVDVLRERLDARCVELRRKFADGTSSARVAADGALTSATAAAFAPASAVATAAASSAAVAVAAATHGATASVPGPDAPECIAAVDLNRRVNEALAHIDTVISDATLRPEVRVATIFATAIAPAARTVRELLQGASAATRAAAQCARAASASVSTDATHAQAQAQARERAPAQPTSIEAQANAIVMAHIAASEKPQCSGKDAARLVELQFAVFRALELEMRPGVEAEKKKKKRWLKETLVLSKLGKLGFQGPAFFERFLNQLTDAFGASLSRSCAGVLAALRLPPRLSRSCLPLVPSASASCLPPRPPLLLTHAPSSPEQALAFPTLCSRCTSTLSTTTSASPPLSRQCRKRSSSVGWMRAAKGRRGGAPPPQSTAGSPLWRVSAEGWRSTAARAARHRRCSSSTLRARRRTRRPSPRPRSQSRSARGARATCATHRSSACRRAPVR
jgi:hypothetical protein